MSLSASVTNISGPYGFYHKSTIFTFNGNIEDCFYQKNRHKYMIFYYSGCGNTRFVANEVSKGLQDSRMIFIPEAQRKAEFEYKLDENEALGFIFPVYCWSSPKLVDKFVKSLKINANNKFVYAVVTCGDDTGYTEKVFRKVLNGSGIHLDACYSVQMPETYINIPGMNLDSEEGAIKKIEAAKIRIAEIVDGLRKRVETSSMVTTSIPFIKTYIIRPLFYAALVTDKKFTVSDECIGCGICADNCPLKNIEMVDNKPAWKGDCTTCNSCYHRCPKNAIQFGKATIGKGQYYFEKLSK